MIKKYEIVPEKSFSVIRNCSGCGRKAAFINTKKFRVNANGNRIDVWLIYQCEQCKHTFNLTIYERKNPTLIPNEEYEQFLCNDEALAKEYGKKIQFFRSNKAEVNYQSVPYCFSLIKEDTHDGTLPRQCYYEIQNPYGLKIRREKQIAEVLGVSRSNVKSLIEQGKLVIGEVTPFYLSFTVKD